ncbi:uncharacterized protein C8Q71DRAFT_872296 [Rhodofomes roseus]|uniref:Reverse transcriptase zinc-binding domain-containing protein n=1 Tax=Rhodofomes roseus TaxID=34475 RepID=A0ABQ8KC82_9APHY|nr:uncharacterized protein C8Q71DRAFT_872296 [Rhodofomes roseus]KAH9835048.1 hypothetical protein C8Q71DRAFT_872296 [Rhodofomes roseus]
MESNILAKILIDRLPEWEDRGWIGISGATYLRALVNRLRQRCAVTTFRTPASQEEQSLRNDISDRLQTRWARAQQIPVPPTEVSAFKLSGARVAVLTQQIAYKGIRAHARTPKRPSTMRTISSVLTHVQNKEEAALEALIWRSGRHKDLARPIADFLWKNLHKAYKVGTYWSHIPNYEDRAECKPCGVTENMDHILLKCNADHQDTLWRLTLRLLHKKGFTRTSLSYEDILSIGLSPKSNKNSPIREPHLRLRRIAVSETAYLIWKLRCERVIRHEDDPEWRHNIQSVIAKWFYTINRRLRLDIWSTKRRFGRLQRNKNLVLATWTKVLEDELALPEDWTTVHRFLVGIDPELCSDIDPG